MAKKAMVEREKKRARLIEKSAEKRAELKESLRTSKAAAEKLDISRKIQRLPRDSSATRRRNRFMVTGRPRGYYRDFGLSRNVLREWAHEGLLPGVVKSSW